MVHKQSNARRFPKKNIYGIATKMNLGSVVARNWPTLNPQPRKCKSATRLDSDSP